MPIDDPNGNQRITLAGADGQEYVCQILGLFDFEDKQYGLLLRLDDEGQGVSTVLMRLVEKDAGTVFRTIDNNDEFERATAFIRTFLEEEATEESGR